MADGKKEGACILGRKKTASQAELENSNIYIFFLTLLT